MGSLLHLGRLSQPLSSHLPLLVKSASTVSLNTPNGVEGVVQEVQGGSPAGWRRVKMVYARWYEIVIVIFVLLWLFGQLGGQGGGYYGH